MVSSRTSASAASTAAEAIPADRDAGSMPDWVVRAVEQGIKPEQALAYIGLGLMRKVAGDEPQMQWIRNEEEDGGSADLAALRRRLELVRLALDTGAPLSTAEVTQLLGARPGAAQVERGGLKARRLSRNVWKLSRRDEESERAATRFDEGFRRRL